MTDWRRITRAEWPRSYPVAQFPNAPLGAALVASVVGHVTSGRVHDLATAVFYVGLGTWAYLELAEGVNLFRRLVGLGGLVYVVVRLADAL